MKFGIFYIPKGEIYQTGSSLLGYDIRKEAFLPLPKEIDPKWVKINSPFGFHMTITDVVEIEGKQLGEIEKTLQELLTCLPKNYQYKLELKDVDFWEKNPTQAAIRYRSSESLIVLHTLLVCSIQKLGISSFYLEQLKKGNTDTWTREMINKTKLFYSPYIFDEFKPHFSLFNPFKEEDREGVLEYLRSLFMEYKTIIVDSLYITIKEDLDQNFKIYKEIPLNLD